MPRSALAHLPTGHDLARAAPEDLPAIVELLLDDPLGQTRENPSDPAYAAAFAAIDADPAHLLVVALDREQVVGTLQLTFVPGLSRQGALRAQIEGVRVSRTARGSGLGAAMVQWAIDYSRERGADLLQLTTDKTRTRAHTFYERLGFVASHEGMKVML